MNTRITYISIDDLNCAQLAIVSLVVGVGGGTRREEQGASVEARGAQDVADGPALAIGVEAREVDGRLASRQRDYVQRERELRVREHSFAAPLGMRSRPREQHHLAAAIQHRAAVRHLHVRGIGHHSTISTDTLGHWPVLTLCVLLIGP